MNCNTDRDRETYKFYQAAINALELRLLEDNPGCPVPPRGFVPSASKDTALTAFAQLGALRLNVNRGLISLLDGNYQYVLAEATRTLTLLPNIEANPDDDLWLGSVIIPRSRGICEHVLNLGDIVTQPTDANSNVPAIVINDLAEDPRFSNRSYVKSEPGVRFYAGVPLRSPWGTVIGAYCVFGHEPRNGLTQEQLMALQGISSTIMTYLETSKAKEGHQRYEQMLHGLASFVAGEPSLHTFEDQSMSSEKSSIQPRISHDDPVVSKQTTSSPSNTVPQQSELPKTPPERVQSPRTKKRPRGLSTPTPMARKKSTVSLQEVMLPSGSKRMFAQAANIVRESIDLCGCIIFDASVASFGGAINTPHRRSSVEAQFGNLDTCSSETSSGQASGSDHPSPPGEPWEFGTHHSRLERDDVPDMKLCEVLGFSYRDSKSIVGDGEDVCCAELPESDLKRLLRKYPFGHIFNTPSSGDKFPSQEDDHPAVTASSLEATQHKGGRQLTTRELPTNKSSAMLQKLLEVAPGARSIAILPLWDYQRDRWFAGCLCWTTEPSRILYPDVDLIYLQAFGNSIMMELSRLDAISSDRAKTTFVASISHELRCPLHGILGGIQFLQDTQLNPYQSGMLESVAMCGKTLLETIDHVLDFAEINTFSKLSAKTSSTVGQENTSSAGFKSSQGMSEPETLLAGTNLALLTEEVVETVFVGQAHRGVLSRLEQTADQNTAKPSSNTTLPSDADRVAYYTSKAICIILDIPNRASWLVATQPGAWRRVVMNLFGNAIKYTTSGQIRVSLRIKPPELSPKQDSGNIEVTLVVSDSGKGISPEYLRGGLWRPFSQEDSSTPGTGLGLSIVRQIVQGLKGKISLRSEVEAGTEVRVSVSLPLTEASPSSGDDDHFFSLATAQLRGCRVCILEATTPDGLDGPSPVVQKSRREFGISLSRTLKEWFGVDAVVSNVLTALSAKVIFCLEPRLDFLATLKGLLSPEKRPLVIFITLDASKTARLRADPRVNGSDFVAEVITQPCGPRKLARSLTHALDRREKRALLNLTPLTSPVKDSAETNSPAQEWKSPNWIPTHLGNAHFGSHARSNSIMDPNSIPRSLLDKYATSKSMQQPPTESQLRILLVDDNRINLSLLTAFMRRYNFDYEEAMNGLQAVETYQQANGEFDYVLMDLTMPVMDGMAATREIRRYEQRKGIRPTFVIALTGLASATARVEALSSGINYFLTKPVKFQALHQILKGAVSES